MKQLSLFAQSCSSDNINQLRVNYWKLYVDGASRNNPGHAGAGIYIIKNDEPFIKKSFYLGLKTNNQAEYLALLLGLYILKSHLEKDDLVQILSDSQLLVRQVNGAYKIKHPDLQPLNRAVQRFLTGVNYSIVHIMREENERADELANRGVDGRIPVPEDFLTTLRTYETSNS